MRKINLFTVSFIEIYVYEKIRDYDIHIQRRRERIICQKFLEMMGN